MTFGAAGIAIASNSARYADRAIRSRDSSLLLHLKPACLNA